MADHLRKRVLWTCATLRVVEIVAAASVLCTAPDRWEVPVSPLDLGAFWLPDILVVPALQRMAWFVAIAMQSVDGAGDAPACGAIAVIGSFSVFVSIILTAVLFAIILPEWCDEHPARRGRVSRAPVISMGVPQILAAASFAPLLPASVSACFTLGGFWIPALGPMLLSVARAAPPTRLVAWTVAWNVAAQISLGLMCTCHIYRAERPPPTPPSQPPRRLLRTAPAAPCGAGGMLLAGVPRAHQPPLPAASRTGAPARPWSLA